MPKVDELTRIRQAIANREAAEIRARARRDTIRKKRSEPPPSEDEIRRIQRYSRERGIDAFEAARQVIAEREPQAARSSRRS